MTLELVSFVPVYIYTPGRMPHPVGGAVGLTLLVLTCVKTVTKPEQKQGLATTNQFDCRAHFLQEPPSLFEWSVCTKCETYTDLPGHITAGKQAVELRLL